MNLTPLDIQRFWSKVALPDEDGCCLWQACLSQGYGRFSAQGQILPAHRLALRLTEGPPPDEVMDAAHSCRNRHCVAPAHLRWATRRENLRDRVRDNTMNNGARNGQAVLTAEQVLEVRARYAAGGVTQLQLGVEYGVRRSTIGLIVNGKKWRHLPMPGVA